MKVKIENACFWGEGKDRKGYGAGSVIDVPEDVQELNKSWMKPTDDKEHRVAYNPEAEAKPAKDDKDEKADKPAK